MEKVRLVFVLALVVMCPLVFGAAPAQSSSTKSVQKITAAHRKADQSFSDCRQCPAMMALPAGSYTMGSPAAEPGADPIEGPQHRVDVRAFAIGKFDVTRGQWAAFASATHRPTQLGCAWTGRGMNDAKGSWSDTGFAQEDDSHPVVCVSWNDACDYVRWLSATTHHDYRLPSEAEWEYAARAGTKTAYPWGAAASHEQANYGADKCCSGLASGRDKWVNTSPVGSFPPNAFGLFDMHGNALQWMRDCFASSYAGLPTDGSAYETHVTLKLTGDLASMSGTDSCAYHVLRGGDWGDYPALIRSGFRSLAPPPGSPAGDYRSGGVGFRVVREL